MIDPKFGVEEIVEDLETAILAFVAVLRFEEDDFTSWVYL
jgi:hypothetical protein